MFKLTLILVSFLIGLGCIRHLRAYDVHEKEPFGTMLTVTLWGGIASVAISLFLYRILSANGISIRGGFPFSFLYIGFTEEGAKLLALAFCWPLIRKEMNEPTDGPIYMACVALGFSLIENYFYAQAHPHLTALLAIRLIICTPMHIAFSMFMGLAFFWATRFKGGWGVLLVAYIAASIYHSLYDIFVSFWYLLPGLYLILKSAYAWMYRLLGYTAAHSPFRQTLTEFIHSCPAPSIEPGLKCLECTNGAPKPTYTNGRIKIQRCEACGTYLCTDRTLQNLVHQYGSIFGSLKRHIKKGPGHNRTRVLIAGNRIDPKQHTACFHLDEFNDVLEKTSADLSRKLERKWWFPLRAAYED
jgi:RsiW-degrading membrane proteinase PrsW (M82 family)